MRTASYYKIIQGEGTSDYTFQNTMIIFKEYDKAVNFIEVYACRNRYKKDVDYFKDGEYYYTNGEKFITLKPEYSETYEIACELTENINEKYIKELYKTIVQANELFEAGRETSKVLVLKDFM